MEAKGLPRPVARRGDLRGGASAPGFTLLEVMMVTAILTIVLGGTTFYLVTMSDTVATETSHSYLEVNGARTLSNLADELVDGYVSSPAPAAGSGLASSFIQIKRPADLNGNGSILDEIQGGGNVFGVRAPWGDENGYVQYSFVPHPDSARASVSEADLDFDINGDDDEVDVFVRGQIVRTWHGSDTLRERTQTVLWNVLQVGTGAGNYGGYEDEDGNVDPIFSMAAGGKTLTISVWLYGRDGRRHVVHNARTGVMLRNQP